jgi:hypothetical protein
MDMSETSRRGFDGLQLDGKLNADATVQNPNDLDSPVNVMVRGPNGNFTVMFRKPNQPNAFENKHTRRVRSNSVTDLTSQYSASAKMAQYAEEASKHAARRWQNAGDKTNTLVFLTLDGYCKLAAYIVDQSAGRTWHPYGNPPRQQMDLMFIMHECLAFSDNGYGKATNTGVGIRFEITIEQDPQNAHVLYVVHLESAAAQNKIEESTLTAPKNAPALGQMFTNVGSRLGH